MPHAIGAVVYSLRWRFVEHVDGKHGFIEDLKCEELEEAIELHKCEGKDLEEESEDEQIHA